MSHISMGWMNFNGRLPGLLKAALAAHAASFLSLGGLQVFCKAPGYSIF